VSDRPRDPGDEELEELSDDVILAQESAVHAPQRRTNVATDARSVVISEPPLGKRGEHSPTVRTRREASEKTVVIRDRRQLDKMRKAMSERPGLKPRRRLIEPRTLYLLAAAAVGSLVVGTLIAALVDSQRSDALLPVPSASSAVQAKHPAPATSADAPETIDLDSLPVDRTHRVNR
jgi:hypothetical protein